MILLLPKINLFTRNKLEFPSEFSLFVQILFFERSHQKIYIYFFGFRFLTVSRKEDRDVPKCHILYVAAGFRRNSTFYRNSGIKIIYKFKKFEKYGNLILKIFENIPFCLLSHYFKYFLTVLNFFQFPICVFSVKRLFEYHQKVFLMITIMSVWTIS